MEIVWSARFCPEGVLDRRAGTTWPASARKTLNVIDNTAKLRLRRSTRSKMWNEILIIVLDSYDREKILLLLSVVGNKHNYKSVLSLL